MGQSGRIACLAMFIMCLTSCHRGGFQDNRDYFQSVYGLNVQPLHLLGSSFIGRVVDAQGNTLPYSKIYLKGSPLYTTSNQKGGFYLTGLKEGPNTVFIVSPNGLGRTLHVNLNENLWTEDNHIVLEKLIRMSGRVSSGAASVSEARLIVEGSPFSTLSNDEGQYILELPVGLYDFKAQHLLYNPFSMTGFDVKGDRVQDINLEPLSFPKVDLTLDQSENFVLRGLTTRINIHKNPSVRYMRVVSASRRVSEMNSVSSRWEDVKDHLVLQHKNPGFSFLHLQFMDQFGKMTDPIFISYYNTLYDRSWRLISGHITDALHIGKNEKVAFLGQTFRKIASTDNSPGAPPNEPVEGSAVGTANGMTFESVKIDAPVEIEPGAIIQGSAQFNRGLKLRGSLSHPIHWMLRTETGDEATVWVRGSDVQLHNARLQGGHMVFDGNYTNLSKAGQWQFENLQFEDTFLEFQKPHHQESSIWDVRFCTFIRSTVSFSNGGATAEPGVPSESTPFFLPPVPHTMSISVISSVFNHSNFQNALNSDSALNQSVDLTLEQNNFFGSLPNETYLSLTELNSGSEPHIQLKIEGNYFEDRTQIIDNFEIWRTHLGRILDEPMASSGAIFP
ncbi:MAG: carboxypeptidase-like regulatory domain-containing protein [Pseudobdellovibrionaceae bacterium]|nr:carboxypeptidase-like regulatory domain-containing protein [Pseudobdellovibrionaceae bacterium]